MMRRDIRTRFLLWLKRRQRDLPGIVASLLVVAGVIVAAAWYGRHTGEHMADPNWLCFYGSKGVACTSQLAR